MGGDIDGCEFRGEAGRVLISAEEGVVATEGDNVVAGVRVADEVVIATPGAFVLKPREMPHTIFNPGTERSRILQVPPHVAAPPRESPFACTRVYRCSLMARPGRAVPEQSAKWALIYPFRVWSWGDRYSWR